MEGKTEDGYSVIYGGLLDLDPTHYDYTFNMKLFAMVCDLWVFTTGSTKGNVIIVDLRGLSMGHVTRFSASTLKKFLYYLQ